MVTSHQFLLICRQPSVLNIPVQVLIWRAECRKGEICGEGPSRSDVVQLGMQGSWGLMKSESCFYSASLKCFLRIISWDPWTKKRWPWLPPTSALKCKPKGSRMAWVWEPAFFFFFLNFLLMPNTIKEMVKRTLGSLLGQHIQVGTGILRNTPPSPMKRHLHP